MDEKIVVELDSVIDKMINTVQTRAGKDGLNRYSESLGYHRTYCRKAIVSRSVTMLRNILKGGRT